MSARSSEKLEQDKTKPDTERVVSQTKSKTNQKQQESNECNRTFLNESKVRMKQEAGKPLTIS